MLALWGEAVMTDVERFVAIAAEVRENMADLRRALDAHMADHNTHVARHNDDDIGMALIIEQITEFQRFLLRHPEEHDLHRARHAVNEQYGKPLISVHRPPAEWGG